MIDRQTDDGLPFLRATADQLFAPSELYHENSKLRASDIATYITIKSVNTSPDIRRVITRPFASYRGHPSIALTREFSPSAKPIETVIVERRSRRAFSGAPLRLDTLAKILYLGDGIVTKQEADDGTEWLLRTAPSGGGLFPVDLYCLIVNVDGAAPGLYFYNALEHRLEQVTTTDLTDVLCEATALDEPVRRAGACIMMTGFMQRSKFKYGERAYRFVLLEAGHIAQNLLLAAEAEDIGAVPLGGFLDDHLNRALGLDGCDEAVLYLVLLGS